METASSTLQRSDGFLHRIVEFSTVSVDKSVGNFIHYPLSCLIQSIFYLLPILEATYNPFKFSTLDKNPLFTIV